MKEKTPIFLPRTIPDYFNDSVVQFADRPAIDFLGTRYTYNKLSLLVDKVATALQKRGVKRGTRVGLCLPNCPYYTIFYFAILKLGAIVVNFNPLYVTRELEFQAKDAQVKIMVTLDLKQLYDKISALKSKGTLKTVIVCPFGQILPIIKRLFLNTIKRRELARYQQTSTRVCFNRLIKDVDPAELEPRRIEPEDIALLQYTGGTTGVPKGAILTHRNISANMEQIKLRLHGINPGNEKSLCVVPFFHVLGMTAVQNLSIMIGAEMIMVPRFEIKMLMSIMKRTHPTLIAGVPTIYTAINEYKNVHKYGLSSIRYAISGGAPLPVEVQKRFEGLSGAKLIEGYGLSESSPLVSVNPMEGPFKPGSIGTAVEWTHVEFRDLEQPSRKVARGQKGELCVSGPQVMKGYWNKPEATAKTLEGGKLLRTGDVGYIDDDGFIFLVDRIKDMILCSGYNVYPRVIEEALYEHSSVEEVVVIGVPHSYRGQAPKAFVKLRENTSATENQLKDFLSTRISKIEMPSNIEFRVELPKTLVGKLSKKELIDEEAAKKRDS